MQFDVLSRTIFLAEHGSRAYGLATPTSDIDIKGICIPPLEYYLGFLKNFEQSESMHALVSEDNDVLSRYHGKEVDSVVYSLKKFANLAADCNPNIIEVLYSSNEGIIKIDKFGQKLMENRDLFLSKKARWTFSGYAHSQLKRIERHRKWLLNPPAHPPSRTEMGLPERTIIPADQLAAAESAVQKKMDEWNLNEVTCPDLALRVQIQRILEEIVAEMNVTMDEKWLSAARAVGYDENFIMLMYKERSYKSKKNDWDHYQRWKLNRNPARAILEEKHGYDTKHGSHLLRLMRMCKEILSNQGVIVKRPDAEELLALKLHGVMSYDDLLEEATRLEKECDDLYKTSVLPAKPDKNTLDKLIVDITNEYIEIYR